MGRIRMVVSDMDGTLLDRKKCISPRNQAAIHRLKEEGIFFAVATGRSRSEIRRSWGKAALPVASVTLNGAKVLLAGEEVLYEETLSQEMLMVIHERLLSRNVYYEAVCEDCVYTFSREGRRRVVGRILQRTRPNLLTPEEIEADIRFRHTEFIPEREMGRLWQKEKVHKLRVYESEEAGVTAIQQLLAGVPQIHISASNNWSLEVNSERATKGRGLSLLAEHYGIPLEEVLAIGDHLNDVPMMQVAGISVAVANARPEVKRECDAVVACHDEDGFYEAVERFVFGQ